MEVSDKCERQSKDFFSVAFMPKDTIDQPCDFILVVKDGKQFKAHRQVLSEASPFFEKLLNSDMKESKEGVVRLEMFSETVMENTLEFIYTGSRYFIYVIGGVEYEHGIKPNYLIDVDRYDLRKDQWSKVADIHEGCWYHWGAAVNEKKFVAGKSEWVHSIKIAVLLSQTYHCEVYDETTNEWQVIESLKGGLLEKLLVLGDKLYAVCSLLFTTTVTCKKS
ncbi:uncharacterized protein LOC144632325 [Oculina patagonica]